ncbi:MAG: hypothetical protein LBT74_13535 [Acidobacteriota bacterium]|jgi:hypothetical protein|nr:hypothetical protein [Acidobacteriota bacterium]
MDRKAAKADHVRGECLRRRWPKWLPYVGPQWKFVRDCESEFWAGYDEEELGQYDYEWARKFYVFDWFGAGWCFWQSEATVYVGSRSADEVYAELLARWENQR